MKWLVFAPVILVDILSMTLGTGAVTLILRPSPHLSVSTISTLDSIRLLLQKHHHCFCEVLQHFPFPTKWYTTFFLSVFVPPGQQILFHPTVHTFSFLCLPVPDCCLDFPLIDVDACFPDFVLDPQVNQYHLLLVSLPPRAAVVCFPSISSTSPLVL